MMEYLGPTMDKSFDITFVAILFDCQGSELQSVFKSSVFLSHRYFSIILNVLITNAGVECTAY